MPKNPKRPRDPNQLAKMIVDMSTGEPPLTLASAPAKNAAAVELGRLGGLKGGKARAKALTSKQRADIATMAAAARWHPDNG